MRPLRPLLALCSLCLSSCTWLDHFPSSDLERELLEKSKQGLALARYPYGDQDFTHLTKLGFVDKQRSVLALACCSRAQAQTVSHNRLLVLDLTSSSPMKSSFMADSWAPNGPVVVMDNQGKVLERSDLVVNAMLLSLSPDEKEFAFLGSSLESKEWGVFVAGFQGRTTRRLAVADAHSPLDLTEPPSLSWSPDGQSLVFSDTKTVVLLNAHTGESRKLADGSFAQWSPSGDWISYATPQREAILLNIATGQHKKIDPHHEASAMEWSPDGKYLLLRETGGSHVPYGCWWIYRISDSAWLPLPNVGIGGPLPHWIDLHDAA